LVVVRPVAVGALAEAAVDIVANLDTFEPDLRRKLDAVMNRVGRDSQRQWKKVGGDSGKSFAESMADNVEKTAARDFERAGEAAGGGFGNGLRRTARSAAGDSGDDAGGFFSRAFEAAAGRAVGGALLRTFGAGLAAVVTSATPLSTVLGGGAAAVVALAAAISQAAAASLSLLGVLGALGLAGGTLTVGFQGVGDAMKAQTKAMEELRTEGEISTATQEKLDAALKNLAPSAAAVVRELGAMAPAWQAVRRNVQENLFAGVAQSLAQLGNTFLPILNSQLGTAATTLSQTGRSLVSFLTTGSRANQINGIFTGLNKILRTLLQPLGVLTGGFLDIFTASLPFAQQLATVLANIGTQFGTWLGKVADSEGFQRFMEDAMQTAGTLFQLLGNIGSIIGSVFGAGTEAGGNLLTLLRDLTGQAALFLRSAAGQEALASFFGLIAQAGQILVGVFRVLSPLLSGIGAVFDAMRPALQQLGAALIPVIAQLSTSLGAALSQLAPLFAQIVVALTPLVTTILNVLVTQFTNLIPTIVAIVAGIVPLVQALVTGLVPAFQAFLPISAQLAPILLQVAQAFLAALLPSIQAIVPLIPLLVTSALQLVSAFISLLPSLIPLIEPAAQLSLALTNLLLAFTPLIPPMIQIATIAISQLGPALTAIVGFITPVITSLTNLINTITNVVSTIVGFVANALSQFAALRSGGASQMEALKGTVVSIFGGLIADVLSKLTGWVSSAVEIAGRVGSGIIGAVKSGLSGLASAFSAPFEAARSAVSGAIERIVGVVSGAVGRIQSLVSQITGALGKIKLPGGIGNIDIPGFARGGIVSSPTIAALGEGWRKEAVIPLENQPRAAELMDKTGLTQLALERVLGGVTVSGGAGRTREIHMPVTVAGLTKEETIQILRDFLANTFGGARIGLDLGDGVTL
jgi:phage-related protein